MSEHLFDLFRLELLADLAPEYLIHGFSFTFFPSCETTISETNVSQLGNKELLPDYFKHLQTAGPSVEIFKQCGIPFIRSPVQLPELSAFQQIPLPTNDMPDCCFIFIAILVTSRYFRHVPPLRIGSVLLFSLWFHMT